MKSAAYSISKGVLTTMSISVLRKEIRKNKKFRQLKESFANNRLFKIPFKRYKEEVMTLHTARQVKSLIKYTEGGTARLVDQIVKANILDQGTRSRLTEIQMQCFRASSSIQESVKIFKNYALYKWGAQLRAYRTKAEREAALDVILSDLLEYAAEAENLSALAELVIKDIDKAGYSLQRSISALETHHKPERKL